MPVPKPAITASPRALLRDVVYAKMLDAIQDGTLEPGERLNDDQLTAWLGVSRTPVREAIARLESEGLVEMAANRYTRVAGLSGAAHDEAADLLDALHSSAIARADTASAHTRKVAATAGGEVADSLAAHDLAAYRTLLDTVGALIAAQGNALYAATERAVRGRVIFHAAAADAHIDWDAAARTAAALAAI
ncbi:GntR family transcriptional regulator [Curtobacterium sp. HSID17257]|uniref:GntR family transcriptional regulator n=1 Tax=Curtobacterium sp. HSID17257 TaxID=2419510 RepID=UPI000F8926E0|nr:GntR family transcriptional regulator [Curtobacterium sp. HSID17257]RUQ09441.1 GntR family transcriptional regulator [Curtobacterium sp. HSID17257]